MLISSNMHIHNMQSRDNGCQLYVKSCMSNACINATEMAYTGRSACAVETVVNLGGQYKGIQLTSPHTPSQGDRARAAADGARE